MDEMMDKYDRQLLSQIRSIARSQGTVPEDENTKVITARKRIKEYKDDVRRRVEDFKNLCLAHNMALGVFPVEPAAPAQPEVSPTTEKTV